MKTSWDKSFNTFFFPALRRRVRQTCRVLQLLCLSLLDLHTIWFPPPPQTPLHPPPPSSLPPPHLQPRPLRPSTHLPSPRRQAAPKLTSWLSSLAPWRRPRRRNSAFFAAEARDVVSGRQDEPACDPAIRFLKYLFWRCVVGQSFTWLLFL